MDFIPQIEMWKMICDIKLRTQLVPAYALEAHQGYFLADTARDIMGNLTSIHQTFCYDPPPPNRKMKAFQHMNIIFEIRTHLLR